MAEDDLIVIHHANVDVQEIMQQIRAKIAARQGESADRAEVDPVAISHEVWTKTLGLTAGSQGEDDLLQSLRLDSDIMPRDYEIAWINPILGPVHAVVRRVINAEIRRYLDTSLSKQSRFNEGLLDAFAALLSENRKLRQELKELRDIPDANR